MVRSPPLAASFKVLFFLIPDSFFLAGFLVSSRFQFRGVTLRPFMSFISWLYSRYSSERLTCDPSKKRDNSKSGERVRAAIAEWWNVWRKGKIKHNNTQRSEKGAVLRATNYLTTHYNSTAFFICPAAICCVVAIILQFANPISSAPICNTNQRQARRQRLDVRNVPRHRKWQNRK